MSAKRVAVMLSIMLCGAGISLGQTVWTYDPVNPVCEPGPPGSWDDGGCWTASVVFDGSTYHMWYTGMKQNWENLDIGHATSPDGVVWTKNPAPVLLHGDPGAWDDWGIRGAAVIWDGALFHMWYEGIHNDGIGRACYATSPDGTDWDKIACNLPGLEPGVPNVWDQDTVRPHTVIVEGGTYRMWYRGARYLGSTLGWSDRVGYAESLDGVNWTKRPDPVLVPTEEWEGMGTGDPYVVLLNSTYHMWYTAGTENYAGIDLSIGYAFSPNGINWTKSAANPVVRATNGFDFSSPVIFDGAVWHMNHSYCDGSAFYVYHAESECCAGLFGDDFETGDTSLWSVTVP